MRKNNRILSKTFLTLSLLGLIGISSFAENTNSYSRFLNKKSVGINAQNNRLPKVVSLNEQGTFREDLTAFNISPETLTNEFHAIFGLKESEHTFEKQRDYVDNIGMQHQIYQHSYKGVPIEGELVMVHSKNNVVKSINGQITNIEDLDVTNMLSDAEVKNIVLAGQKGTAEKINVSDKIKTIISKIQFEGKINHHIVKKVYVINANTADIKNYYVDAVSGKVLFEETKIYHADTPGTGKTYYRGNQPITVDSYNGQYRLKDNGRNIHVFNAIDVYNIDSFTAQLIGDVYDYTNATPNFTSAATEAPVEILWGLAQTHDYYAEIHQRNSYDNNGSIVKGYYNFSDEVFGFGFNAGAYAIDVENNPYMLYGMGYSGLMDIVVGLDVAGHEFSHLVISRNGNGGLIYQGESGALNESFADMFGTAIEFYTNLSPNWKIGENIWLLEPGHMRNMANPKDAYPDPLMDQRQPDTYEGEFWADTSGTTEASDYGGVHTNSGIGNYWFYLLSEGGSGTNDVGNSYSVTAQTIQKAEKIAYRALMNYMTTTATYMDARVATIQAAQDLYGDDSAEAAAVANAWYAVNVGPNTVSVTKQEFKSNITVYPNPVTDNQLNIDVNTGISSTVEVALYDVLGKQVLSSLTLDKGNNTIDVSTLTAGVYILKFEADGSYYSQKVVITK